MIEVIKSDGTRQPFSERKLRSSVENAAKEAAIPASRFKHVISEAVQEPLEWSKGKRAVETRAIRENVLTRLDAIEPKVSQAWRAFDQKKAKA